MNEWICLDCLVTTSTLTVHGRCPHCSSSAVDVADRGHNRVETPRDREVVELEKLYKLSVS